MKLVAAILFTILAFVAVLTAVPYALLILGGAALLGLLCLIFLFFARMFGVVKGSQQEPRSTNR